MASKSLGGLQYVRAAAATMVVLDHVSGLTSFPKYLGRTLYGSFFKFGIVGVDLFFVLSGFIMVYIALKPSLEPRLSPAEFFRRRVARIIPFMWAAIVLYATLRFSATGFLPLADYARAFTLFPLGTVEPNVIWTLRHEMLFYAVFALTFLTGRKWLMLAWALSPLALSVIGLPHAMGIGGLQDLVGFICNKVNMLFGIGVIIGLAYVSGRVHLQARRWIPVVMLAGIAAVFVLAYLVDYDRSADWQILAIGLVSGAVVFLALWIPNDTGPIARTALFLGDASYSIYLTHMIASSFIVRIVLQYLAWLPDAAILMLVTATALGFSSLIYVVVERPIVSLAQRWLIAPRMAAHV